MMKNTGCISKFAFKVLISCVLALLIIAQCIMLSGCGNKEPNNNSSIDMADSVQDNNSSPSYESPSTAIFDYSFTERTISDIPSAKQSVEDVSEILGIRDVDAELGSCKCSNIFETQVYRFYQQYNDIPVYGKNVVVTADKNGNAQSLVSNYRSVDGVEINPKISSEDAIEAITNYVGENGEKYVVLLDSPANLYIYEANDGKAYLCYSIWAECGPISSNVFVDAENADIIAVESKTYEVTGYKASDTEHSHGFLISEDGAGYIMVDPMRKLSVFMFDGNVKSTEDVIINGIKHTNSYFGKGEFLRSDNIIWGDTKKEQKALYEDGADLLLYAEYLYDVYGAYGVEFDFPIFLYYNDAFDYGANALGGMMNDNLGVLTMGKLTGVHRVEVVAHEFTHIVSSAIVEWNNNSETKGVNEAYSDIMGVLLKSMITGESPKWIIANVRGNRDIINPQSPQLVNYKDFNKGIDSHYSSTILSHAAYLMYVGINGDPGFEALESSDIIRLFMTAMYSMPSDCSFSDARTILENTAAQMLENQAISHEQFNCIEEALKRSGIPSSPKVMYGVNPEFNLFVYDADSFICDNFMVEARPIDDNWFVSGAVTHSFTVQGSSPMNIKLENGKSYVLNISDLDKNKWSRKVYINTDKQYREKLYIMADFNTQSADSAITDPITPTPVAKEPDNFGTLLLRDDPFAAAQDKFTLNSYDVLGGFILDSSGKPRNTYTQFLDDMPVIALISDDFAHDGSDISVTVQKRETIGGNKGSIDMTIALSNGRIHTFSKLIGDEWSGMSKYCYIVKGDRSDYLVVESVQPLTCMTTNDVFHIGYNNGNRREKIMVLRFSDMTCFNYSLDYDLKNKICMLKDNNTILYYENSTGDYPYVTFESALKHVNDALNELGIVGIIKGDNSQMPSERIIPLFSESFSGIQMDIPFEEAPDCTLNSSVIIGVNAALSKETVPESNSLFKIVRGTWDSDDGKTRLRFIQKGDTKIDIVTEGDTHYFNSTTGENASNGSVYVIDLEEGEINNGFYSTLEDTIYFDIGNKKYETDYTCSKDILEIGGEKFHRVEDMIVNQLIGEWEGEDKRIVFESEGRIYIYYGSKQNSFTSSKSSGRYVVLNENEVLINTNKYPYVENYSLVGYALELGYDSLVKNGVDTSYYNLNRIKTALLGQWKCNRSIQRDYYIFKDDGTYEYFTESDYENGIVSNEYFYEVIDINTIKVYRSVTDNLPIIFKMEIDGTLTRTDIYTFNELPITYECLYQQCPQQ